MDRLFWLVPLVMGGVWIMTGLLRRYALARNLLDVPNARSSHELPTTRGGGMAIVLGFGLSVLALTDLIGVRTMVAYIGSGGLVALLGFLDDHGHVSARWRLLGHISAAVWFLIWIGGFESSNLSFGAWLPGWLWQVVAIFMLVWLLNLYNFMDGIDGLAGIEAVTVCFSGALIIWLYEPGFEAILPLMLGVSALAFLFWNFPPARIFMGDVGSGFIGIVIGGMVIEAANLDSALLFAWLILAGVFIVDATFTLFRRLFRGDRIYEAHRSHAYQFASRQLGGHRQVTLAVAAINVVWLLPLALLTSLQIVSGWVGLAIAYAPLMALAIYFKAGDRAGQALAEHV